MPSTQKYKFLQSLSLKDQLKLNETSFLINKTETNSMPYSQQSPLSDYMPIFVNRKNSQNNANTQASYNDDIVYQLHDKIKTLETTLDSQKQIERDLSQKLQIHIGERYQLTQAFWQLRSEITTKQAQIDDLKLQVHSKELCLDEKQKECEAIQQKLVKLERSHRCKIEDLQAILSEYRSQLNNYKSQLQEKQSSEVKKDRSKLERSNKILKDKLEIQRDVNEWLKDQIKKSSLEATPPPNMRKYSPSSHSPKTASPTPTNSKQVAVIMKQNTILKTKIQQLLANEENLEKALNYKQGDFNNREELWKQRIQKVEMRLKARMKEYLNKDIFKDYKDKLKKLYVHINKQQMIIKQLEEKLKEKDKQSLEIENLQKQVEAKEKEIKIKQAKIQQYIKSVKELEQINSNLKNQALKLTLANDVEEVEYWKSKCKAFENENKQLLKIKEMNEELLKHDNEHKELQTKYQSLQQDNNKLKSEIDLLQLKLENKLLLSTDEAYENQINGLVGRIEKNKILLQNKDQQMKVDQAKQLQIELFQMELETNQINEDMKQLDNEIEDILFRKIDIMNEQLFDLDQYLQ